VAELPPPLPPAERTVGQLIAETIRAYGNAFWRSLPLGVPLALVDHFSIHRTAQAQLLVYWAATPLFVGAFLWACHVIHGRRPTLAAAIVATIIYLPFPVLRATYLLPGIAWFALIGLAVPAAMIESLDVRSALVRGRRLGVADYAHALGSLAALVIVVGVAAEVLSVLLHSQDGAQRLALFTSDVVLGPLLFLGGALLYVDQAARVGSGRPLRRRRRNADLHPPLDAEPAGHPDHQVEP
jgi:hypothetical protein